MVAKRDRLRETAVSGRPHLNKRPFFNGKTVFQCHLKMMKTVFSGAILRYLCIFNRKTLKKAGISSEDVSVFHSITLIDRTYINRSCNTLGAYLRGRWEGDVADLLIQKSSFEMKNSSFIMQRSSF